MNRQNLRKVDLQLLVIFEAMMHERKVSRVGEKLHMAQPTVSSALARLRLYFDDPLFVRMGHRMEPTSRAHEISLHLGPALDHMAHAISATEVFNPRSSDAVFRLGLADDVELAFMPQLLREVMREAPNVKLVISPVDWSTVSDQLSEGTITLAVSPTVQLPARAKKRAVRRGHGFVLRGDGCTRRLTLAEYCSRPHIQVSTFADSNSAIDDCLEKLGLERQVVMSVPRYSILAQVLLDNPECLAVLPEYAASVMAKTSGLLCEPLPFKGPHRQLDMVWLTAHDRDPAERWLRGLVQRTMGAERDRGVSSRPVLAMTEVAC